MQGWIYEDLWRESAQELVALDLPSYAVGVLAVDESKEERHATLEHNLPHLSGLKLRYLMEVGKPENIVERGTPWH